MEWQHEITYAGWTLETRKRKGRWWDGDVESRMCYRNTKTMERDGIVTVGHECDGEPTRGSDGELTLGTTDKSRSW